MTVPEQPAEKLDFKRVLPILVIVLVDLIGLSIIIPILPYFAARFSATPIMIGILQASYPFMQFVGAPMLGRLSDRFGRRPILIVSQIGTLAGFILLGFANTLWLLFLSRIIDGLSGANMSTAQAAIADSTTEKTRTQGLGLIGAAFGVGFVSGSHDRVSCLGSFAWQLSSGCFYGGDFLVGIHLVDNVLVPRNTPKRFAFDHIAQIAFHFQDNARRVETSNCWISACDHVLLSDCIWRV